MIIVKDGKYLLGKRKGSHGEGSWSFPGGHLEFGESLETCAKRETLEEVGVKIKNIKKIGYTNDIFKKEGKHYITCFVKAELASGEIKNMEPEKCERWDWFTWDKFPKPLFTPIKNFRKEYKLG